MVIMIDHKYKNVGFGFLLGGIVLSSYRSIRAALLLNFDQTRLYMALVIVALINNVTEATFKGVSIVWSFFLLVSMDASLISRSETRLDTQERSHDIGRK